MHGPVLPGSANSPRQRLISTHADIQHAHASAQPRRHVGPTPAHVRICVGPPRARTSEVPHSMHAVQERPRLAISQHARSCASSRRRAFLQQPIRVRVLAPMARTARSWRHGGAHSATTGAAQALARCHHHHLLLLLLLLLAQRHQPPQGVRQLLCYATQCCGGLSGVAVPRAVAMRCPPPPRHRRWQGILGADR